MGWRQQARALGVATTVVAMMGGDALAGGFELPDNGTFSLGRGGAFMVRADDPTALIYNPGGLIRVPGTRLSYDHALIWEDATFTRAETDLPPGQDYGTTPNAPVTNEDGLFPLGATAIIASDLGLENWAFALGVYGPSAHGTKSYPVQGGQRYMLTELEAVLLYPSLAIAYGERDSFGVGVTLQYVIAPSLNMSLVVDASPGGGLHAYHSSNDVIANIEMSDYTAFTAIVGGWWRPTPALEVGLSGRVVPIALGFEGDVTLSRVPGQTQFTDEQLAIDGSSASMDLTLPPIVRAGVRYRHLDGDREVFDLELDVVWEMWSVVERYDVDLEGTINLFGGEPAPDAVIEKRWQDSVSVRLGGTVNLLDGALMLSAGGYWERGAVPENYEHLDFMSFDRVGLGLGVTGQVGPVRLKAAYLHVFQEDRTVSERFGKVYQVRPLDPCPESCDGGAGWDGVPANAGTFESSYEMVSFGIEAGF